MKSKNSITRSPVFRVICLLILCGVLASCSMLRVAYTNSETLGYWWLDSYADFDRDQRIVVKEKLSKLYDWHRKTQLRDYSQLLNEGQRRLQQTPDKELVAADIANIKQRMIVIIDYLAPDMADLALSLTPAQIKHIEKKFAAGNQDYAKDFLRGDSEQRHRERLRKILDQAEYWFGEFSREQEVQLKGLEQAVPLDNERYLQARLKRQQDILTILTRIQAEKPPRDLAAKWLRDVLQLHFMHTGGSEFVSFIDAYNEGMVNLGVGLIQLTTPAQKTQAITKLQGLINDFRELAGQP